MFMREVGGGKGIVEGEVEEEKRGEEEGAEEAADRVIVRQRERIEEMARLVEKKGEILNGVRRIAEKNLKKEDRNSPSVKYATGFSSISNKEFILVEDTHIIESKITQVPLGNA